MTSNTLSPFAAQFHKIAAFITEHELPEADITVRDTSIISIGFHTGSTEQPENAFWRYAHALGFLVEVQPYEDKDGCAAEILVCNGTRDGVFYICQLLRPVLATVPA